MKLTDEQVNQAAHNAALSQYQDTDHPEFESTKNGYIIGVNDCLNLKDLLSDYIFEKEWIPATNPPKEGGRYWCYCKEINDLGISHFQWNCSYDIQENSWRDNHETYNVTHWTELLPPPNK